MFPQLLRTQLIRNQSKLYMNSLRLVSESTVTTLVNGTPETTTTQATHWEGLGSLQYVRPRIQKSMADVNQGTMEDPVSIVCYLPHVAEPTEGMVVVDLDGVLGDANQAYPQSRMPANVGGVSVYWELYLGLPSND